MNSSTSLEDQIFVTLKISTAKEEMKGKFKFREKKKRIIILSYLYYLFKIEEKMQNIVFPLLQDNFCSKLNLLILPLNRLENIKDQEPLAFHSFLKLT